MTPRRAAGLRDRTGGPTMSHGDSFHFPTVQTMTPHTTPARAEDSRPLTFPAPDVKPAELSDVELLQSAIAATPDPRPTKAGKAIPATQFAASVAKCNDRTLRRYLAGDRPLPVLLRDKLETIVRDAAKKAARAAKA